MTHAQIESNKVVSLTYSILDDKGKILEQSDLPVSYVHGGHSDLFEKLEQALTGKSVGDEVTVTLSPEDSFGQHNPDLTFTDDLENVPTELRYVGAELEAQNASGEVMKFVVSSIDNNKFTVDGNHPFAGKTVTFRVKVAEVRDATAEELQSGQPASPGQGHLLQ